MPLKVSDGMGAWIDDFAKSDAPQFKGKNKDERRDMAIAAYLSAKRGGKKQEDTYQEAMSAKNRADMDRAMAAFKKRGGKIKKLPPAKAQGYHGKDDPGKGVHGVMDRPDTKRFGTRKKVGSMRESVVWEAIDPKIQRVKMLARLGLVGKSDVNKLMMAMKAIDDGKELNKQYRNIIFDAFNDLIDLVTGDTTVFQKAKKAVSTKEQVVYEADDKDPGEYDDEGIMMKDKLDIIMDACDEMYDIVEDDENLPEWVQDKVTKAADYIDSARDYLMSQKKDNSEAVNELSFDKMNKYHSAAQKSKDRATNSAVATILRKGDHSKDLQTRNKRMKGMALAKSRTLKKIRGEK